MCLAIPAKVLKVFEHGVEVDLMGNTKQINTDLVGEKLGPGDYVLVHAGYALERVEEEFAFETLALFEEALEKGEY